MKNIKSNATCKFIFILAILATTFLIACSKQESSSTNPKQPNWSDDIAMIVSVSSDGNYTVTSNLNKQIVLWDIKNRTHKIIATNANIYSAYFIKKTHYFMWQNDDTNEVNIADVNGQIIKSFNPGFPTYGQVMTTDLQHYFASDDNWSIYSVSNSSKKLIKGGFNSGDFFGIGKLLNLTLSNDNKCLLSSGAVFNDTYDKLPLRKGVDAHTAGIIQSELGNFSLLEGVTTWNVTTGKPLRKLPGNASKTFATFSPEGKYIVNGDVAGLCYVWCATSGKLKFSLDSMKFGHPVDPNKPMGKYDKTGLIPVPKDFHDQMNMYRETVLAMKFIDKTHYLRFTTGIPYVIVYSVDSPQPLKYIKIAGPIKTADLTKERYPAVAEYVRDQAIDTAPKAHILVIGQQKGNGIIVFKYDPKTMTLKKIWVGNFCGPRSANPKCW